MPKRLNTASLAYERVVAKISVEYEALDPEQRVQFIFLMTQTMRGEFVKYLQQGVVNGGG